MNLFFSTGEAVLALVTHLGQPLYPVVQLPTRYVKCFRVFGFKRKLRVVQMHMNVLEFWPIVQAEDEI